VFRVGSEAERTRRQIYAHRWVWEHYKGEIPDGLQVNHHCDNSLCVNPEHLYLGTQNENMRDLQRRGPSPGHCRGQQGFVIAVDTREKRPYRFAISEIRSLKTGDYSIVGMEDRVAVERKRLEELFDITGRDRERFERELERMAALDFAAIVIEADLPRVLRGAGFSHVSPKAVIGSLVSWCIRYRAHVFFAGDRRHANALTARLLEKYWRYRNGDADAGSR
jgi:ERCC4-type nuclease